MSEQDADFVMTLSSELISEVVQQYFKTLFKKPVQIVDLMPAPNGDGYAFSVAFVRELPAEVVKSKIEELEESGVEWPKHPEYDYSKYIANPEGELVPMKSVDPIYQDSFARKVIDARDKNGRFVKKAKVQ